MIKGLSKKTKLKLILLGTAIGILAGRLPSGFRDLDFYNYQTVNPKPQEVELDCKPLDNSNAILELTKKMQEDSLREMREYQKKSNDLSEMEPSIWELKELLGYTLPYVASVLNTKKVHRPRIALVEELEGSSGVYDLENDTIFVARTFRYGFLTNSNAKPTIAHELLHSQYRTGDKINAFMDHVFMDPYLYLPARLLFLFVPEKYQTREKYLNHKFVEVTTLEIVAREALEGDIDKFEFAREVENSIRGLSVRDKESYKSQSDYIQPAKVLLDILSCKLSEYEGVKFYGIRRLLKNSL